MGRQALLGVVVLLCIAAARAARGGQVLEDTFDRERLEGAQLAWRPHGTWVLREGRLVNECKGREEWPHLRVGFYAPRPVARGGVVRVDVVHEQWTRVEGCVGLRASDRETGAYVEWVSHSNSRDLTYRTSDTEPQFRPLPATCVWEAGKPATCAIRWAGRDAATGKGAVELLLRVGRGQEAKLTRVARAQVANLHSLDYFELVVNARDQRAVAPLVGFDNFYIELSDCPDAPTGLRALPDDGRVLLTWRAPRAAGAHVVQRAESAAGGWGQVARVAAPGTRYVDAQARPSVLYRYRLRAENPEGPSLWTPPVSVVVPGPPLRPVGLRARARASGLVWLDWQSPAVNARRFVLERRVGGAAGWAFWRAVDVQTTSLTDVLAEAPARYRVCAVNELGPSAWSDEAEAERPTPPPTVRSPAGRIVHARKEDLPVTGVDLELDRPLAAPLLARDFTIAAVRHPWEDVALPEPEIARVVSAPGSRSVRVEFAPALADRVEYRVRLVPSARAAGRGPVRVGVLLGDDDGDGFVAPAEGQRRGRRLAMPPMPIGIMGEDIEWQAARGASNAATIIRLMEAYRGIDFFRVNLWWGQLEPEEGRFDERYIAELGRVLEAATERQLPVELGLRQEQWPLWVCKHKGFSTRLYQPGAAAKLADTWRRLAELCRQWPVVFGYWPMSEEYPARTDVKQYLAFLKTVVGALRAAHPGCVVKVRPYCSPEQGGYELTPLVSQTGPQDLCMACGSYPTGPQWDIRNPNPLGRASLNNLQRLRYYAPAVQGGANAVGEMGFRVAAGSDFGDAERLLAFERSMALAWDLGLAEFVIWGEQWSFDDPALYFPRLTAFRDALVRTPRRSAFDLRLVNDGNVAFALAPYRPSPGADYSAAFEWLEERGYRFYVTVPAAMPHQRGQHAASLNLSELTGKKPAAQIAALREALKSVEPTGRVLPWRPVPGHRLSITGLQCLVDVEFSGARGLCDAVSLGPGRVQLYAPPDTVVRWRRGAEDAWHVLTTASDCRITVLAVAER